MKYPRFWIAVHGGALKAAKRKDAPKSVLRVLAEDENWFVRRGVVRNPSAPEDVLRRLAEDESWHTRHIVAEHLSTSEDVLRLLAEDENTDVSYTAVKSLRKRGLL